MTTSSDRIEQIEDLIQTLIEVNGEIPVIVEGNQDVRCLRRLGLEGSVIKVHAGKSLYEFCAEVSEHHPRVVLLMDWDRKGQQLHDQLARDLEAGWRPYARLRDEMIRLCSPDIQEVEHLGQLLKRLKLLEEMPGNKEHGPC